MAFHGKLSIYTNLMAIAILILTVSSADALSYRRPPARSVLHIPKNNQSPTSVEQVHISLVGKRNMRISWISEEITEPIVRYGMYKNNLKRSATGSAGAYKYLRYKSGHIYDVVIGPLKANTIYYYTCGTDTSQNFHLKTPPALLPIRFAVAGDLGQTEWTRSTLDHIAKSDYDVLLLPGDLAYAEKRQHKWDSFGRLVSPLASSRPWMVTHGNHELETIPLIHPHPFTAYNARWHMPHRESGSESNHYYSYDVGAVHVIMLGSYVDFGPQSAQYKWLENDLRNLDRTMVKWVFVNVHAPWYNSNKKHQGEAASVKMRYFMEQMIFEGQVDIVFAGHVHAYERFSRVYNGKHNTCAPYYIVVGDGGNFEGLDVRYMKPQPEISLYRESSFGHGRLKVVNVTHAMWTWHRNNDHDAVVADWAWLRSLSSKPACRRRNIS